ncbi:MAG: UDP-N-acetylmuramate--L-alanine ligase, partial [Patescibacteria group bacterium]
KINLGKTKRPFFIGIGGIGISAIARMFLLEGPSTELRVKKKVSGSDMAESEVTVELRKLGALVFLNQRAENVPADCDLVIYTIAVPPDNPEFAEAKRRGIPMMSYPEALGEISRGKFTIAVSGTHGKTTTTAMIAKILIDAKLDPTVVVGSLIKDETGRRTNFIGGKSKYFVVEACEYKRSFLNINPKVVVITNIDADHLDYYKDIDGVIKGFSEFAAKVSKSGYIVTNIKDKSIKLAIKNLTCKIVDYKMLQVTSYKLQVLGQHNILNAQAALAVAEILGIDATIAQSALSGFRGTWRRFEFCGKTENGALVYDDYGHHPTEILATLAGARELFPKQKIVVVFQPHLYSRTKDHLTAFGKCFKDADEVIILPIYPAREKDPGDINSEMIVTEIKKKGQPAFFASNFADAVTRAKSLSKSGDLIITLGAGETNKVAALLV